MDFNNQHTSLQTFDIFFKQKQTKKTIHIYFNSFNYSNNNIKIYIPSKWKVAFKASESINKRLNEKI